MICFHCRNKIEKKEHYFVFVEMQKGKEFHKDYAHKKCWDEVKGALNQANEANRMLKGMKNFLTSQGILPPEEIEVRG